jgi:Tfp pilus assembly protein PilF
VTAAAATPLAARARALAVLAAGIAGACAALGPVRDTDTFHHLALARALFRTGLPTSEQFVFPLLGAPTTAPPYWLGSAAIGAAHALLGLAGLVALPMAMGAAVAALLLACAEEGGALRLAGAGAAVLLALAEVRVRAVARPEIFGVALLALTLLAIRRHAAGRPRALLAFPGVALLWSNLHPSVAVGLAAVGAYAAWTLAAAALRRARGLAASLRGALVPAAVAAAGLALAAVNPSAASPVREALGFAASSSGAGAGVAGAAGGPAAVLQHVRHFVVEVQPLGPDAWRSPLALLMALALAGALAAPRRARPWELALAGGLVVLAWSAARFAVFAAVAAAPSAADALGAGAARLGTWRPRAGSAAAAAGLAAAAGAIAAAGIPFAAGLHAENFPVRAAEVLAALGGAPRLFSPMQFGGYLEWRLDAPVYQDGRGVLLPGEEDGAFRGPGTDAFERLDARYRFDALVLAYPLWDAAEASALAAARPGDWAADRARWALVAFDDGALLYLRRDGALAAAIAGREFRAALPANALAPPLLADPAWSGEMERAVAEAPACLRCRLQLAHGLLEAGRPADAEALVGPALDAGEPYRADALLVAGAAAADRGDLPRARRLLSHAAGLAPSRVAARRVLARIALRAGDPAEARARAEANLKEIPESREDLDLALAAATAAGDGAGAQALRARLQGADRMAQAEASHEQGLALAVAGRHAEAVAAYRRSLALFEGSAAAHSNLGWSYFDLGDPAAALREQDRALQLDPGLAPAHYGRAVALEAGGDAAGAVRAFREYLRLEPRGAWALNAEERIRALQR